MDHGGREGGRYLLVFQLWSKTSSGSSRNSAGVCATHGVGCTNQVKVVNSELAPRHLQASIERTVRSRGVFEPQDFADLFGPSDLQSVEEAFLGFSVTQQLLMFPDPKCFSIVWVLVDLGVSLKTA
jgi:hypothetical protein